MSCYHPNIMTYSPNGVKKDGVLQLNKDGTVRKWIFQGAGFEEEVDGDIAYRLVNNPNSVCFKDQPDIYNIDGEYQYSLMVPCQQCLGCRIDYSKHWADRIVMEQLISPKDSCWFITLTYDDPHLLTECMTGQSFEYTVSGESCVIQGATLVKEHVQLFMKRLRSYYKDKYNHDGIRFFLAGEYGELTRRPHYHLCVFNLPIFDLEVYANNFRGDVLYNSDTIERIWNKGYVVIGELNWETAAYTARYVVKKFKGKQSEDFYNSVGGVLPEFTLSSRRPGIAAEYFNKEVERIYRHDCIQLPSSKDRDGHTTVPRYFDKLLLNYLDDHPESDINLDKIKAERRANAEAQTYNRRILSGLFDREYFKLKEEAFKRSASLLSRKNFDKYLDI